MSGSLPKVARRCRPSLGRERRQRLKHNGDNEVAVVEVAVEIVADQPRPTTSSHLPVRSQTRSRRRRSVAPPLRTCIGCRRVARRRSLCAWCTSVKALSASVPVRLVARMALSRVARMRRARRQAPIVLESAPHRSRQTRSTSCEASFEPGRLRSRRLGDHCLGGTGSSSLSAAPGSSASGIRRPLRSWCPRPNSGQGKDVPATRSARWTRWFRRVCFFGRFGGTQCVPKTNPGVREAGSSSSRASSR